MIAGRSGRKSEMGKTENEVLYDFLMSFLNIPYIYGGNTPIPGLDCSALSLRLVRAMGFNWPDMTADSMWHRTVPTHQKGIRTFCFYGKISDTGVVTRATHVAPMVNDRFIIEAGGGDRHTKTVEQAIEKNAFVRIRPYNFRNDFIGFRVVV